MKNLYILSKNELDIVKNTLSSRFDKVAIFEINLNENSLNLLQNGQDMEFFGSLIDEFEQVSEKNDFVIVVGTQDCGLLGRFELNLKIAKNLNSPIFTSEFKNKLQWLNQNSKLVISDDINEILNLKQEIITPSRFCLNLQKQAKAKNTSVVLPESDDDRILKAADFILSKQLVNIILLGDSEKINKRAKEINLDLSKATIINNENSELLDEFVDKIYELRKHKGLSKEQAQKLAKDKNYFGTMLVATNRAGAMVSGANTTTADTIRPALQLIKTQKGTSVVSGSFFMLLDEEVLLYADCAITPKPDATALSQIAISSADTAKSFDIEPKVAMLSYSTGESGSGESVELVKEAFNITKQTRADLSIEAPIQYDAAVDAVVANKKMPNSSVAGKANVFIFPDLNAGNICCKAVQRSANALAIGPVLQGLNKPVNDLSRGALVDDIVNTILISAIQSKE